MRGVIHVGCVGGCLTRGWFEAGQLLFGGQMDPTEGHRTFRPFKFTHITVLFERELLVMQMSHLPTKLKSGLIRSREEKYILLELHFNGFGRKRRQENVLGSEAFVHVIEV